MPVKVGPVKAQPVNASADDEASTASAAYLIALAMLLRCSGSHSMASGLMAVYHGRGMEDVWSHMPPCFMMTEDRQQGSVFYKE